MAIKLWMLICVAVMTDGSSEQTAKKLFGSKMCAFLCRRTTKCSKFLVSESTCVLHTSSTGGGGMCISDRILTQDMGERQCCPRCYKVIYIRRRSLQCIASSTDGTTERSTTSRNLHPKESGYDHARPKTFLLGRRGSPVVKAHSTKDLASTDGTKGRSTTSRNLGTTESGHDRPRTKIVSRPLSRRGSPVVKTHPTKDPVSPAPRRQRGKTPQGNLIPACRAGDLAKVKLLLKKDGVDLNFFQHWQKPPVMMAARWKHKDVVEFLVNKGADLSLVDQFHNNVLHAACIGGNVKIVKFLLSLKVLDINRKGHSGKTPLLLAALFKHDDVVDLLLSKGAAVSRVDNGGNNVLHCACLGGNVIVVKRILSLGVPDKHARNKLGKTAADLARDKRFNGVTKLLASFGVYK